MHANFFMETLKQNAAAAQLLTGHSGSRLGLKSRTARAQPAAVCNRCNAFSFASDTVNQRCTRTRAGTPCIGKFASTRLSTALQKCAACDATGWHGGMVCSQCQSVGWLLSRQH